MIYDVSEMRRLKNLLAEAEREAAKRRGRLAPSAPPKAAAAVRLGSQLQQLVELPEAITNETDAFRKSFLYIT